MNTCYTFSEDFELITNRLLTKDQLSTSERKFVAGVQKHGIKTKTISFNQMRVLGCIYKKHVQRDEYMSHNWTIWK